MKISAQQKKSVVRAVRSGEKTVLEVAREIGVARKTVYSWIKQYSDTPSRKKSEAFDLKYVAGADHPRSVSFKARKTLERLIVHHPEWGCRK